MKIYLLTVGDELLIGQVVDTNSAWIARFVNDHGGQVVEKRSVPDELDAMISGIDEALAKADVVLMTGGLGPTKDDVTKKAIAKYFGVGFVFSDETYDRILRFFEKIGRPTTDAHRNQCFMPQNAELMTNKMGTAPGMWFAAGEKVLVSMPGVPYEMKYLMEYEVMPRLQEQFPSDPILHRTILTVGEGESRIAQRIEDLEDALPPEIKLAFLPNLGRVRLRLTAKGPDEDQLRVLLDEWQSKIEARIPELIFGHEKEALEAVIGEKLMNQNWTIATAESCTGGLVAHKITSVPGSSRYFQGSIVAYANEVKMQQLGVQASTLQNHGAVSEQTVQEMVHGVVD
ncbi:MAG: CinA family nicotinamide mononucleotide deamidase-related protein, partial [Bacteroidota bacterium]